MKHDYLRDLKDNSIVFGLSSLKLLTLGLIAIYLVFDKINRAGQIVVETFPISQVNYWSITSLQFSEHVMAMCTAALLPCLLTK